MSDDAIFREVDEEVRAEQFQKLWKQYGAYVSGAAISVVLIVAGIKAWQYWQIKQAEEDGEQYLAATTLLKTSKKEDAIEAFGNLASAGSTGFAVLAKFQIAADFAKQGAKDKAVKIFDDIAAAQGVDLALRNLAKIRAALLSLDSEASAAIEKRIGSLNIADGAWRHSAREIIATSAYRNGDLSRADRIFNELISDPATPTRLRQRAQIMISVITPKLLQEPRADAEKPKSNEKQTSGATD